MIIFMLEKARWKAWGRWFAVLQEKKSHLWRSYWNSQGKWAWWLLWGRSGWRDVDGFMHILADLKTVLMEHSIKPTNQTQQPPLIRWRTWMRFLVIRVFFPPLLNGKSKNHPSFYLFIALLVTPVPDASTVTIWVGKWEKGSSSSIH